MSSELDNSGLLFISYRRTDSYAVDQLVQACRYRFGAQNVVQDVLSFVPGADFLAETTKRIARCRLMIVVIGRDWCGAGDQAIKVRTNDWVRREIEIAIEAQRPLLPVLLGAAQLPRAEKLPASLEPLLRRTALQLRSGEDAPGDMRKVLGAAALYMPRNWPRIARDTGFLVTGMCMALAGASWLGSKALFPGYAPTQWPNLLLGLGFAALLPAVALAEQVGRLTSVKWRPPTALHRQRTMQAAWAASAAILFCGLLWPAVTHIDDLYGALESTRSETPRVVQHLEAVGRMPRYAGSDDVRVAEKALFVRQRTTLTEDEVNEVLNFFAPYRKHPDARIRTWATLTSAEAFRFVDRTDAQIDLYRLLANDPKATSWQRWYAYMELGSIYYTSKHDPAEAGRYWEAALQYRRTRGLLENLATLEENQGHWEKAAQRYQEADEVIQRYKREKGLVTLADQEAGLYSNWCNMLRKQANQAPGADVVQLQQQAVTMCKKAVAAYSPYMDARWNLARVQLDQRDFRGADETLRTAVGDLLDLRRTSPKSLDRYGYTEYGEQYSIWLLVVSRFLSQQPLETDRRLLDSFQRSVVGLQQVADAAVLRLLTEMKKRGLTMDEDKAFLQQMQQSRYLNSIAPSKAARR